MSSRSTGRNTLDLRPSFTLFPFFQDAVSAFRVSRDIIIDQVNHRFGGRVGFTFYPGSATVTQQGENDRAATD
jgi:hypothetical protein